MERMLPPEPTAPTRARVVAFAWTAAVAILLLVPVSIRPPGPEALAELPLDKLVHALLFLGLARVWRRALPTAPRLAIVVSATAFGGLLELVQGALGVRSAEWGDAAANALGAALGAFLPLLL